MSVHPSRNVNLLARELFVFVNSGPFYVSSKDLNWKCILSLQFPVNAFAMVGFDYKLSFSSDGHLASLEEDCFFSFS